MNLIRSLLYDETNALYLGVGVFIRRRGSRVRFFLHMTVSA
jgi:hypothetical protein